MTDFTPDNGTLIVVTPDEAFRVVVGDEVFIAHAEGTLRDHRVIAISDYEIVVAVGNIIAGTMDEAIVAIPIADLEEIITR
jgi:hypothetical protein